MKLTANEIMELNIWEQFCTFFGINVYAVNEGLSEGHEFEITLEQFKNLTS